MPRNYQLKRFKECLLPHNVYMQVVYIIKDYERLLEEKEQILHGSTFPDGMPKGNDISNPTETKAEKLIQITDKLNAIDQTSVEMIGYYSDRVEAFKPIEAFFNYDYFSYTLSKGDGYAEITWKRYRQRFAYLVAQKLKMI
ncbi:MAG: hypothetical protein IIW54_15595 [Lachnospiraceae bacterium]|nr:hypothetical protein [Lachnospiraceae bacterium]